MSVAIHSIEYAKSKLRKLGLRVWTENRNNVQKIWSNAPQGEGIDFIFEGAASGNIMNSPKLMLGLSESIINKCSGIIGVGFGVAHTDWWTYFGVVEGVVKQFESESNPYCSDIYIWGYYCSL